MSDTYRIYLAKVKSCDKNFLGIKRTPKKIIIMLKILKDEVKNKKDLTKNQKSEILRRISKRMLEFM